MFYQRLFSALNEAGIQYLVAGGVAVVLHGAVRMTADLDLAIALDEKNVRGFLQLLKKEGYRPKIPVALEDFSDPQKRQTWKREKGMRVFSLYHPQRPEELIDVFIEDPLPFYKAYDRKKTVRAGDVAVSLFSIEDLIQMKKMSNRPQDKADIQALRQLLP